MLSNTEINIRIDIDSITYKDAQKYLEEFTPIITVFKSSEFSSEINRIIINLLRLLKKFGDNFKPKYSYEHILKIIHDDIYILHRAYYSNSLKYYLSLLNEKDALDALFKYTQDYKSTNSFIIEKLDEVSNLNHLDKVAVKNLIADTCYELALNKDDNYALRLMRIQKAVVLYKELASKDYNKALRLYDEVAKLSLSNMHSMPIKDYIENEKYIKQRKFNCDLFINGFDSARSLLNICPGALDVDVDGLMTRIYTGVHIQQKVKHKPIIYDLASRTTFSETRTVRNLTWEENMEFLGMTIHTDFNIIPYIEGIINNALVEPTEFIDEILKSNNILDEDKDHIRMALNHLFSRDVVSFIYIITPNIEKILRNIITNKGHLPYHNKPSDPNYQTMFNMTDSIRFIQEKQLMPEVYISFISKKLNEESYQNYRNNILHKYKTDIFNPVVAYELMHILILLTFEL